MSREPHPGWLVAAMIFGVIATLLWNIETPHAGPATIPTPASAEKMPASTAAEPNESAVGAVPSEHDTASHAAGKTSPAQSPGIEGDNQNAHRMNQNMPVSQSTPPAEQHAPQPATATGRTYQPVYQMPRRRLLGRFRR